MIIVISGYNQRAVIAFLRTLKRNNIEEYAILARDKEDPVFQTSYADKVYYVRKHKELDEEELYSIFDELVLKSSGPTVIAPSTEALNRFLVHNKKEIESHGVIVPLVDESLYSEISDKRSFFELCKNHELKVPEIITLDKTFTCRYVAKPIKYISNSGQRLIPIIVQNVEQHRHFMNNYSIEDFDIQEYVDGESYYLLYYLSRNGKNYSFSQRNLAQQPGGKSIVAAMCSDIHKLDISNQYIDLVRSRGFSGFIMIELRKRDCDFYMIEANPRMWGPSQLYVDANVPFVEAFLSDYKLINKYRENEIVNNARYFWSGGLKNNILDDVDCVWLEGGKDIVTKGIDGFIKYDIYNREDTKAVYLLEKKAWEEQ